jgi:hypothetical protein
VRRGCLQKARPDIGVCVIKDEEKEECNDGHDDEE